MESLLRVLVGLMLFCASCAWRRCSTSAFRPSITSMSSLRTSSAAFDAMLRIDSRRARDVIDDGDEDKCRVGRVGVVGGVGSVGRVEALGWSGRLATLPGARSLVRRASLNTSSACCCASSAAGSGSSASNRVTAAPGNRECRRASRRAPHVDVEAIRCHDVVQRVRLGGVLKDELGSERRGRVGTREVMRENMTRPER